MNKVYVGDIGTEIILDCGSNITTATVLQIRAQKPSGAVVTWTAAISGTNSVRYVVASGDLDEAGAWILQAYVRLPAWDGLGESYRLRVHAPFA